jgi:hypothetical protein
VKRISLIRIVLFWLLAACFALCQNAPSKSSARHAAKSPPANVQRHTGSLAKALPDAPSAKVLQAARLQKMAAVTGSTLSPTTVLLPAKQEGANALVAPEKPVAIELPEAPSMLYQPAPAAKENTVFLTRYLEPYALRRAIHYSPSSSATLMGRATDAASRLFITRDEAGNRHLNTPYLLRALTVVAAANASSRYRARSGAAPLSDFGSTVGGDAGMNLLHEFGPGLKQMMSAHMPDLVSRFQHQQTYRNASAVPSR